MAALEHSRSSASSSASSSTSSLFANDASSPRSMTSSLPAGCPCSPSILLNPLPPKSDPKSKKKTVLLTSYESVPPAWHKGGAGEEGGATIFRSASLAPGPTTSRQLTRDVSADRSTVGSSLSSSASVSTKGESSLKFAPLPPGRALYRSNSLNIGVAARASMLQSQGPGVQGQGNVRYGGPQTWYQSGVTPPEIYTYKDISRGIGKLFGSLKGKNSKARARSASTTSSSSQEAAEMERDGKNGKKEIEHIEECEEPPEEDRQLDQNEEDEEEDDREEEGPAFVDCETPPVEHRGRQLGSPHATGAKTPTQYDERTAVSSLADGGSETSSSEAPSTPVDTPREVSLAEKIMPAPLQYGLGWQKA